MENEEDAQMNEMDILKNFLYFYFDDYIQIEKGINKIQNEFIEIENSKKEGRTSILQGKLLQVNLELNSYKGILNA